jgi:hypothetical protein
MADTDDFEEREAQRAHELALAKLAQEKESPWVAWADAFKISLFWLVVGTVLTIYILRG